METTKKGSTGRLVLGILLTMSIVLIFIFTTLISFILYTMEVNETLISSFSYITTFLYLFAILFTPLGIYLLVTQKKSAEPLPIVDGKIRGTATIGEILRTSVDIFLKNIKIFLLLAVLFYIPINTCIEFLWRTEAVQIMIQDMNPARVMKVYDNIGKLFYGTIGLIVVIATIFITGNTIKAENNTLGSSLKVGVKKWGAAFVTTLLMGICLLPLYLLFIIPGVIFMIFWLFYMRVIVLKDISGFQALEYSKRIVKDRWGKIFGYTIVFWLGGLLLGMILGLSYGFLISPYITDPNMSFIADTVFASFIDFIDLFFIVIFTVFFIKFDFIEDSSELKEDNHNDKSIEGAE